MAIIENRAATTVADACRLAIADGVGDYWRNRLVDGALKDALIDNTRLAALWRDHYNDVLKMEAAMRPRPLPSLPAGADRIDTAAFIQRFTEVSA